MELEDEIRMKGLLAPFGSFLRVEYRHHRRRDSNRPMQVCDKLFLLRIGIAELCGHRVGHEGEGAEEGADGGAGDDQCPEDQSAVAESAVRQTEHLAQLLPLLLEGSQFGLSLTTVTLVPRGGDRIDEFGAFGNRLLDLPKQRTGEEPGDEEHVEDAVWTDAKAQTKHHGADERAGHPGRVGNGASREEHETVAGEGEGQEHLKTMIQKFLKW